MTVHPTPAVRVRRVRRSVFLLAGLVAGALLAPAPGATQEGPLPPPAEATVDSLVESFLPGKRIPGLAVGIVKDGQIAYTRGFGSTAPEGGDPVTGETTFRIASVTKPFTSVAILQMAEAGTIDLEDSVGRHCPAFRGDPRAPTIRQLLAHQGGLRHTTDREDTSITGQETLAEAVRRIAGEERIFPPGEQADYTSWGYAVLGCVIEEASGQRYMDYLEEHVFGPAGMTETFQDRPGIEHPGFSPGWRVQRGETVPSEVVDTRFKVSASGLITSAADLSRFFVALFEGRLLGPESTDDLFRVQTTASGETTRYTLGWMTAPGMPGAPGFVYSGSMEGTTAIVYLVPERCYALSILANRERFVPRVAPLIQPVTAALFSGGGTGTCPPSG